MSEWIQALAAACERTSQAQVARQLGVSASMVSQVLGGTYRASTQTLEQRVRLELPDGTVSCPVAGELTVSECRAHQARPFANTNPQRVKLYGACRNGCPHSTIKEGR